MSIPDSPSEPPGGEVAGEAPNLPFPVVGIGASAGGLEAFTQLLKGLPTDTDMCFVLVQHLDPAHESSLTQILGRATPMPVVEATDGLKLEPNRIYVIPPNVALTVSAGALHLEPRAPASGSARAIDTFFESLATDQRHCSIGVILSGTATDGTLGLEAIKAEGGITFAQDDSAAYDSMPRSAVAAGCVDLILSPAEIARELGEIARHPSMAHYIAKVEEGADRTKKDEAASTPDPGVTRILQTLWRRHAVDFALYKSSTIRRRITRRMVLQKIPTAGAYADLLQHNLPEIEALYADLLIGVTSFFRNPESYKTLRELVLEPLTKHSRNTPLRAWVPGCSTGQEAYSLAMLFMETVAKEGSGRSLQIFATDLNEEALQKARGGLYPKTVAQTLSRERLRRFFVEEAGGYRVQKALREMCVFARQDVVRDPPFSQLDLVSCRNMLIYFENTLQRRALPLFHYALKNGGFLFLGASESIGPFTELFEPLDKHHRIFAKKAVPTPAFRMPYPPAHSGMPHQPPAEKSAPSKNQPELNAQREADRVTLNRCAPPGVLIDDALHVLQFRGDTSDYLQPPIGAATLHLLKMTREGLRQPLQAAIEQARASDDVARTENVRLGASSENRVLHIEVLPLKNLKERTFLVFFEEAKEAPGAPKKRAVAVRKGRPRSIAGDTVPEEAVRRIEELERDLAEARDAAQAHQEDFEAANEELQASNEEVQSANEELQSINEELETSKEELESTNEELTTVNEEMANRNAELSRANNDLNNILVSINTAIVLLARDLTIRSFSPLAGRAFNLVAADIGRAFNRIRHQLHGPEIEQMIIEVIDTAAVSECEVQDKDGRWYALRIRPYMTLEKQIDGAVLVLADIDKQLKAVRFSEQRYRRLFEAAYDGILLVDPAKGTIADANPAIAQLLGRHRKELIGRELWQVGLFADPESARQMIGRVRTERSWRDEQLTVPVGIGRQMHLEIVANLYEEQGREVIQCNFRDVTQRQSAVHALRESEDRFRTLTDAAPVLIWRAGPDRKYTHLNKAWLDYTGRTIEQEIGRGWVEYIHPDDREGREDVCGRAFAAREPFTVVYRLRHHDGEYRWLLDRGVPLITSDGVFGGFVGACVDIHDQKENVEAVRAARDAAEEASRAKDQFLATLSHELRTPLTPVLMLAASMEADPELSPELRADFAMVRKNISHEVRIIDDLLDLTLITKGKLALRLEVGDVHQVIRESLEMLATEAQAKGLEVVSELSAPEFIVRGDTARLRQVVCNILKNAVKFTPGGGRIGVRSSVEDGSVHVAITDSGLGILPDEMPLIFDAFAQGEEAASPRFGGLGLGLSISAIIIREHGGRIWAESGGRGQGSTFHFTLPLAPAHAFPTAPGAVRLRPLRILLVEDDCASRETLERLLIRQGHHVSSAGGIVQAREHAVRDRFDIVVSDLGLPDGSGLELMRALRAECGLRGVAFSGYGMEADIEASRQAGFHEHLTKPVSLPVLELAIARALAF